MDLPTSPTNQYQEPVQEPSRTRLTLSLLNFPLTHLRHGYYLKRRCFVCLGTKEATKEKLRCKMDIESMKTVCPAQKDRYNRPSTAQQPPDLYNRSTTAQLPVQLL